MQFRPNTLAILVSGLCLLSPMKSPAQQAEREREETVEVDVIDLSPSVVKGRVDKDREQRNKVYSENVSSLYLGPEELERYQNANPGDLFKGLNGVYSMDPRNGSSITPNIRGLSGEGRVPLTVDGTEQSTNVWLQVYGAGNRNYVDPALFRSVSVEKGPSLSRDLKSGVGGSVDIRTIEAGDIIPDGDDVGFELKLESSGNSVRPRVDANSYFGRDYRDIPGATLGADNNVNIPQPTPRTQGHNDTFNFDDHAEMFAFAARNDFTDLLLSYSYRDKGNYFAGKHGAGRYSHNDAYAQDTSAYYPNLTKLYRPGNEVLSTSSNSRTTLVKNNWYLPDAHRIGLSFMRSELEFGETSPGQAVAMLGMAEELAKQGKTEQLVAEFPRSELRLDTYKLSHEWQPEASPWIDLKSNLWMTRTRGVRHQTGGGAYYIHESPELNAYNRLKADWNACLAGPDWVNGLPSGAPAFNCFTDPSLNPNMGATEPVEPEHDGRIFAGSSQWTSHNRTGFDFSNLFLLSDNLRLTMGGAFQHEKLDERVADVDLSGGIGVGGANFHYSTANYGPRSGERREYSGMFNFEWMATPWLTLTAGVRYNHYSAYDEGLAQRRRQRLASARASKRKIGVELEYGSLMTDAELTRFRELATAVEDARSKVDVSDPRVWKTWDVYASHSSGVTWHQERLPTEDPAFKAAYTALADYAAQHNSRPYENIGQAYYSGGYAGEGFRTSVAAENAAQESALYWKSKVLVPLVDGKPDASRSPFANGGLDLDRTVEAPQGTTGSFRQVAIDRTQGNRGTAVYAAVADDQQWAAPDRQSGDAWSPVFSATARVTTHGTVFLRYAQTTRFPSIFEVASTSVGMEGVGALSVDGASKPERSTNWEVGYAHDLTQLFPDLRLADARLSYFDTSIKDFIERDASLSIIQFDEKKTRGIELQSRFDSGRFFGSFGGTYRLEQKLCDEDYAYGMDVYHNRIPTCMTGGFPDTLTATSLQPRYSLNSELGARLLDERLELGWRTVYHARAENSQLDRLLDSAYGKELWRENSMHQMYWQSVLLHDLYARLNVQKNLDVNLGITNLTDRYYMDPMSKIPVPGPGRTLTAGLRLRF
ncbi:TPA: TonB-dependent receptor [Pseudomonas aeruginosa]|uniref:TonB-dependent receptor n=1 Tax=Pseudomonas aeruginosa TaxID=287 RepID=A0A6A9JX28_PSEAI|nr:TonB-dependent receptor [Pseudomonas aeruginosa]MUI60490.1 TonB-dependent receptor [Pseudomonas aeruginosa]HCF4609320.1 TonB-dependent receptor [Pseudomonas aeruginosa]